MAAPYVEENPVAEIFVFRSCVSRVEPNRFFPQGLFMASTEILCLNLLFLTSPAASEDHVFKT